MDTRTKILTPAQGEGLQPARPLLLVTGHFDILRAELVQELAAARRRATAQALAVAIQPSTDELVPAAARAEMAAALRVVDYVFIAGNEELDRLAAALQPTEIIHLEEADRRRARQLIEHVQRRQC